LPSDFEKCVAAAENNFGLVTIPFFYDENITEFNTFADWLNSVNASDSMTRLSLMRSKTRGKVSIFERETGRGLTTLAPKKLLEKVYLRSLPIFNIDKDGEQLYGEPVDGSRVLLIDDLKIPEPVLGGHQYCILQTSAKNYQHFYVADRPLNCSERHSLQQMLAADHGGDSGATSGVQPHRMPGSINFKAGRELFMTRLIGCSTEGVTIPTILKLAELKTDSGEGCRVLYEPRGPGLQSQSNKDYAFVMKNLRGTEKSRDQLISELNIPSLARGKHADYARLTVDNAIAAKTQLDSRRGR
jgi:RepB DNA-primase from phage plasmid